MELEKAIEEAVLGNSTVFFGSGFLHGAKNLLEKEPKTGKELSKWFATKCSLDDENLPLSETSEIFLEKFGVQELIKHLKNEYTIKEVSSYHKIFAVVPWIRSYTTNYDNSVELSYKQNGKLLQSCCLEDSLQTIDSSKPILLHINGNIETISENSISNGFKLTDTSYINPAIFTSSPWCVRFKTDIKLSSSVFFVGYSMYDLDIKRVLFESSQNRDKCFFITSKRSPQTKDIILQKFGSVITIGIDEFASMVKLKLDTIKAVKTRSIKYNCFLAFDTLDYSIKEFRDNDVFDLLLLGNYNLSNIWHSINTAGFPQFYVQRDVLSSLSKAIIGKKNRLVLVHSDLGNGKSMFINGLCCICLAAGVKPFLLREELDCIEKEIDAILSLDGSKLIIIENYSNQINTLKYLSTFANKDVAIVLTERTAVHDINYDRLSRVLNIDDMVEVDLNILREPEIDKFANFLSTYGLWGEKASWPLERRKRFIRDTCNSELELILLDIINSPDIRQRLAFLFDLMKSKGGYHEVVIAIFALEVLGISFDIDVIMNLLESNIVNSMKFRNDYLVKELISIDSLRINVKSSITSKFILNNLESASLIVDVLIKIVRKSATLFQIAPIYRSIFRELTIFTNIQNLLPKSNKREACIKFFESVKSLSDNQSNPFFWLQYAIARLSFDDFEKTEIYFDTAYSWAKKRPNFNTFQIDNHFARFLLRKSLAIGETSTCMEYFRTANTILSAQSSAGLDYRYYPYRVALLYVNFYNQYFSSLSALDKIFFISSCKILLHNTKNLHERIRGHRYIKEFEQKIGAIISSHSS
jgi:hypothetical protein